MGVHTYTLADITSPVAPKRMFHALQIDNHNFFAKNLPQFFRSIEFVQGDSTTVGCIKQFNFPDGSPIKYMKNRMDKIDFEKHCVKYTTIEGGLGDTFECIVYENKFETSGTGCRFTIIAHYHTKGDAGVEEQDIAYTKEAIKDKVKAVEEYLLANPQVYA
ncbi:hypothetical protein Cgig2_002047 [Carnegiea gigantea]|uniref:Bet v I/Major latex protein domain-containing protein n=1 Tax=Carnegiea gigantea TaxID=171969 RepID=A0A9Q1Q974_9CARY|nr:hypothetical protein Cgig2_002047 [Carnegiea gigantea]